jgi:hypothetical protein
MAERRWQPPAMGGGGSQPGTIAVDEKVVRKMLEVNPALRQGRTTQQIKRAVEQGAPLVAAEPAPPAYRPEERLGGSTELGAGLDDAVGFFLAGKADGLRAALDEIAARRRALDDEERRVKEQLRDQVVAFIALLDGKAVQARGEAALGKHRELLGQLGVRPAELLELARRQRR